MKDTLTEDDIEHMRWRAKRIMGITRRDSWEWRYCISFMAASKKGRMPPPDKYNRVYQIWKDLMDYGYDATLVE